MNLFSLKRITHLIKQQIILIISTLILAFLATSVALAGITYQNADECQTVVIGCQPPIAQIDKLENTHTLMTGLSLVNIRGIYTYKIEFWPSGLEGLSADSNEFIRQVAETMGDSRGWAAANYQFNRVDVGGSFTIVLVSAPILDTAPYSSGCDSNWSCRYGRYVLINEDRWLGATTAWNEASGTLRDYRHMVINHEVGHWLGLGHSLCTPNSGELAPIMQQQSIDLNGCKFNPWPLKYELNSV